MNVYVYINIYPIIMIITLYTRFMHAITLFNSFVFHIILLINMYENDYYNTKYMMKLNDGIVHNKTSNSS